MADIFGNPELSLDMSFDSNIDFSTDTSDYSSIPAETGSPIDFSGILSGLGSLATIGLSIFKTVRNEPDRTLTPGAAGYYAGTSTATSTTGVTAGATVTADGFLNGIDSTMLLIGGGVIIGAIVLVKVLGKK